MIERLTGVHGDRVEGPHIHIKFCTWLGFSGTELLSYASELLLTKIMKYYLCERCRIEDKAEVANLPDTQIILKPVSFEYTNPLCASNCVQG